MSTNYTSNLACPNLANMAQRPTQYDYPSALQPSGEIRLLTASRTGRGSVQCDFVSNRLQKRGETCPQSDNDQDIGGQVWHSTLPYSAISYTWGSDELDQSILVQGQPFPITSNLLHVLEDVCLACPGTLFWIDAICIDQGNHAEKSHQVQQMSSIYEAAEQVVVYLGVGRDGASEDLGVLMQSQQEFEAYCQQHGKYPIWAWLGSPQKAALDRRLDATRQGAALQMLFSHPWFDRVWVIQEVFKARQASIHCAGCSVSARAFALIPVINTKPANWTSHHQAVLDAMPGPDRQSLWRREDLSLSVLLHRFRASKARFNVDKIYALLGLCGDDDAKKALSPDYSKTEAEVVRDTVAYLYSVPRSTLDSFDVNFESVFEAPKIKSDFLDLQLAGKDVNERYELICKVSQSSNDQSELLNQDKSNLRTFLHSWRQEEFLAAAAIINSHTNFAFPTASCPEFAFDACFASLEARRSLEDAMRTRWLAHSTTSNQHKRMRPKPTIMKVYLETALTALMGVAAFSIMQVILRSRDGRSSPSRDSLLASLLGNTSNTEAILQLLEDQCLTDAVPSNMILVRALKQNTSHGLQIMEKIVRRTVSRGSQIYDQFSRSERENMARHFPQCLENAEHYGYEFDPWQWSSV